MPWKTLNDLFLGRVIVLHMEPCIGQPTAKGYAETYVGWCEDINELGIVLRHMQESGDDLFSFHYHDKIGSICQCEDIVDSKADLQQDNEANSDSNT